MPPLVAVVLVWLVVGGLLVTLLVRQYLHASQVPSTRHPRKRLIAGLFGIAILLGGLTVPTLMLWTFVTGEPVQALFPLPTNGRFE